MATARREWPEAVAARSADRLIFLDETWFTTSMARQSGYAPRGQRLVDALPYGHWKTTTFVAGLTAEGFIAPMVLDGPMNTAAFCAYVEQVLAKEVRAGDLLILDNLSSHKTAGTLAALRRHGIEFLHLPPYSPDLNPIELAFSKFKWLVCSPEARTVERLWNLTGELLDRFQPAECTNYLRHCGYTMTPA